MHRKIVIHNKFPSRDAKALAGWGLKIQNDFYRPDQDIPCEIKSNVGGGKLAIKLLEGKWTGWTAIAEARGVSRD